jgi:non-ribosomal peptide synthetase-like protein
MNSKFSEETTFSPTRSLYLQRAVIEFFRVLLPATCFIALTHVLLSAVLVTKEHVSDWALVALFPIYCGLAGITACVIVTLTKRLLMGRYQPAEHPLWSRYVWTNELVTAMYENLACVWLLETLRGTPFLPWYLRTLGCRIGRRCYLETTWFTEFDLAHLGDDVQLNADATVQTHLFEDRVMKQSYVKIDDGCHVGEVSLVLYDTHLQPGSSLGSLSLLMKNETLPAETRWEGIPARRGVSP